MSRCGTESKQSIIRTRRENKYLETRFSFDIDNKMGLIVIVCVWESYIEISSSTLEGDRCNRDEDVTTKPLDKEQPR